MLILENFSYQAAKRSFMNSTRKFIKFSINQHIVTTKQIAKVKSTTLLEWEDPVSLPLFLNAKYQFQIYEQHSFGYNPEELNSIAGGSFMIGEDDTFSSWQVLSDRGNKLGFLSAKIRRKMRYAPNAIAPVESQIVTISSIIAHLSFLQQKRAYIVITVAGKPYKTEMSKSKAGELLFTEQIQIEKTDEVVEAKVEVYSFDAKENKAQVIATGVLKMDPEHPEKKVVVRNDKNETADVYFDYKTTPKQLYTSSKELSKIVQRNSLLNRSTVDQISNYSASRTLNHSSLYGSDLKTSRSKAQRPSIVHHNNNVFMPSQKRFAQYVDKPNQNVSYLRERDGLDFMNQHAKLYYKGASIGVGDKFDFTNVFKTNPGVGTYRLPSLWDRY